MGFFSEIASEARRGTFSAQVSTPAQPTPQPSAHPSPVPVPEAAPNPAESTQKLETSSELPAIDLTAGADADEEAKRRQAHEAAETKRRAEFDARQAAKKAAQQEQIDKLAAMSDADVLAASVARVGSDTEKLTRRNMKEAVAGHIQARCREDTVFACSVMYPAKTMINCFQYINRKAREYAEQEMKDNGVERSDVYGLDVPDGLCYQWAEDYFNDPDAKEDHREDEKFVSKPYVPSAKKTSKVKTGKKEPEKKISSEKRLIKLNALERLVPPLNTIESFQGERWKR